MDFRLGEDSEALRAEAREFLDSTLTPELIERMYRTGVAHDDDFVRQLAERHWLAPGWPVELGGQGRDGIEVLAFSEEFKRAGAPYTGSGITMAVAKMIQAVGNQAQKDAILPRVTRAEILMVLGFSEPESGSDVAAAQTRAVRDGDEWVINGQKMFTTNAHIADYVFLLTRTNSDVAKHKGLTTFLVPMDQPGVEVQAVFTLSGERTNIVYFTDVRVDDFWRIGDVDGGWKVMTASLQDEHGASFGGDSERLLADVEAWAHEGSRLEDPDVRERLARAATEVEVARLLQRRAAWMTHVGMTPEAEAPMSKLFSSEALVRQAEDFAEMLGPDGLRSYFEPTAPQGGAIEHALRFSLGTTTYAGTSEVQRTIIAQRGLGLPRPR
jgi:alkylation response protein AidB-like acyl-CoA dehydrogenase